MNMGSKGQLTAEYIITAGFIFLIVYAMIFYIGEANELNQVMSAVRIGAAEGASADNMAIYPDETFKDYQKERPGLLNPSSVKIVKIDYKNLGFNLTYDKVKIQLRIYASAPSVKDSGYRNCIGDRINFYARKSIAEAFQTQNLSNSVFNPAFSDRYVFTTRDVQWI